ncbi:chemotaxis protein CheR [Oleiphilus sp. HI0071]|nr:MULTISPECIES: protein-glutamate O-methyltransferase CheR [unclassified Oleiphilus]KZY74954.1 chemotaxis protein CheR [Oleiphilus sp. HI0065]KZY83969.1 chemotaxis protein CheR [Oleiphilus sp. HI0071]KZY91092.1 chemotaxis protein CheR [Oleiphilus sp. HI0073]KZZ42115.1 chemotaxis protein CheR [Oleiphilus sp. HI0118]KZZ60438.1 chemotaxis protein CheR [Oleiphilus sp. HI0122]KZZ70930.1 chemotaxis protein CheR [Oleiphilus sp. HI0130]KZZ81918.1 chemotaxis protein CheR [Oleiphilus sp. HI0133]
MGAAAKDIQREFHMSEKDFQAISELAYKYTGIVLGDHKQDMVYGRLARRMRDLRLTSFVDYCQLIQETSQPEVSRFINAITTNLTSFFRESHHFDFLTNNALPDLLKGNNGKIRAWSAGCSTGEEPYSISLTLNEFLPMKAWDIKVLATDLDSNVLQKASQGVYDIERVESLSKSVKSKWFLFDRNHKDIAKVSPSLQQLVRFKRLNLLEAWPMRGRFDFIFCRNVMIYFNEETQVRLLNRFADILNPGGYLFIGHSESLHSVASRFNSLGKTIYQLKG